MPPMMTGALHWPLLLTKVSNSHTLAHLVFHTASGYHAICRELLAHGANVNRENLEGVSALGWAAEQGHVEVVQPLRLPSVVC